MNIEFQKKAIINNRKIKTVNGLWKTILLKDYFK